ncbi:MAG TPA: hypothetical protein VK742_13890 [Candidatus Sulfotelmatobacter sp.]|jgi:hypothetical protein|nr:hypothetical protein [Candidatus Sulfotelmatobacter sp.]
MLLRISLFIAILAGLGAGGLAYYEVSNQIPALVAQRTAEHDAKVDKTNQLNATNRVLKATLAKLSDTEQQLADTQADRDKAVARADAQSKRADDLADKLATATQAKEDAENALAAYKSTDLTPEQIIKLGKQLKDANAEIAAITSEKGVISRHAASLQAKLNQLIGVTPTIELPADLRGKVVVVDPKWDFVVLNIGDKEGVLQDGELLVSRDGKLVAKVIVRSVQGDRCIANVVPGWKLGEMFEGDDVTPAHPAS